MDLGLKGKRALVMGASKGLGRGIADALAAEGAQLAVTARTTAALAGAPGHAIAADVSEPGSMDALADAAVAALGGVDILVLNHGGPPPGLASELDPAVLPAWFARMVVSPVRLATRLLPAMRQRKWGRIITVGSSGMVQPLPAMVLSNMLRAAIVGWNKTLSAEVMADGVTCNILAPGSIRTDRLVELSAARAARQGVEAEALMAQQEAAMPAGRFGRPEEFGAAAAFLASERAAYVSGVIFRVDGANTRAM